MSRMVGSCPIFEEKCERIAQDVLTTWSDNVRCFYDGSIYSKRDFVITASHHWGSAYCSWDLYTKRTLFSRLQQAGATNIIGYVGWNRVYIAFDIKKSVLKEIKHESSGDN